MWPLNLSCALCGAGGCDHACLLCRACRAQLPHLGDACAYCGRVIASGQICAACRSRESPLQQIVSPYRYRFPLDRLIHQLKFAGRLQLAVTCASLMEMEIRKLGGHLPQLLVPVPLHQTRLRERGFNQSLEIARFLSQRLDIPLARDICHRCRPTLPQSELAAAARYANVHNAFQIDAVPAQRHIAIVDDVATTLATAEALARSFRRVDIVRIDLWVLARATPNRR